MNGEIILKEMTYFPFTNGVVDLEKYKFWKDRNSYEKTCLYDSGTYCISEIDTNFIMLHKDGFEDKKVFISKKHVGSFNIGDTVVCNLRKKPLFIYWEIIRFKKYISNT